MELGLLAAAPDTPLSDVADWAAANGFSALEVACWPRGEGATRRYSGVSHIDSAALGDLEAKELVADLAERGIEVSGLGYYPNPLHPDPEHRAEVHQHKTVQENFDGFKAVWPDLVRWAADHGVKIGIENWREVFGYLDGDTLGLNLDPSHLVWQMIDYERVVREFDSRIYHVHAEDMEIDRDGLYDRGVMSAGMGWQVPRLPGLAALYRAGYDHAVVVEHEDRAFEGTDEKVKAGFLQARNAVAPYIA